MVEEIPGLFRLYDYGRIHYFSRIGYICAAQGFEIWGWF